MPGCISDSPTGELSVCMFVENTFTPVTERVLDSDGSSRSVVGHQHQLHPLGNNTMKIMAGLVFD